MLKNSMTAASISSDSDARTVGVCTWHDDHAAVAASMGGVVVLATAGNCCYPMLSQLQQFGLIASKQWPCMVSCK